MARWEQYEVWIRTGGRWEMIASFQDFEPAAAMANNRNERMRLVHVAYDDSTPVQTDVIAEIGGTRDRP